MQYPAWPRRSTTDGTTVYLVTRSSPNTLEAIGITHIDFDGRVFPSRAVLIVRPEALVRRREVRPVWTKVFEITG